MFLKQEFINTKIIIMVTQQRMGNGGEKGKAPREGYKEGFDCIYVLFLTGIVDIQSFLFVCLYFTLYDFNLSEKVNETLYSF